MNNILAVNYSADFLKSITLGELAEAYETRLDSISDLETLFELIKFDWEEDAYNYLTKIREKEDLC